MTANARRFLIYMALFFVCLAMFALAGCSKPSTRIETRYQVQRVAVKAKCPDPATYAGLKKARPAPLRVQKMPDTAQERNALTSAQLGRYEAKGGWADRVEAALDRCQEGEDLTDDPG